MLESVLGTAVIPFRFTTEKKKDYNPNCNAKRYIRKLISRIA